jgi:hypothetical protein
MPKLIISTTGFAGPSYMSMSDEEDITVPQVEDIRYGRRTGQPGTKYDRSYAYIDLTNEQAVGIVTGLLMQLVDEDVLEGGTWASGP